MFFFFWKSPKLARRQRVKNDLILKLVDNILASRYASLTTKSSYFVWSITLQNLNPFCFLFFFLDQHEKFCLLIKFEENLRWWVDFSFFWFIWHGMTHLSKFMIMLFMSECICNCKLIFSMWLIYSLKNPWCNSNALWSNHIHIQPCLPSVVSFHSFPHA